MKKVFVNILVLIYSLVFISVTNGFIIEKYFCSGCNEEHEEVKLFEFGTISHDHPTCSHCEEHELHCTCFDLYEHLNSSKVEYFSLDNIYFPLQKRILEEIKIIDLSYFVAITSDFFKSYFNLGFLNNIIKKPPKQKFFDKNIFRSPSFLCTFLL